MLGGQHHCTDWQEMGLDEDRDGEQRTLAILIPLLTTSVAAIDSRHDCPQCCLPLPWFCQTRCWRRLA